MPKKKEEKKKVKKVKVKQPKNINEASRFLREIGELKRTLEKIGIRLNENIEKEKAKAESLAESYQDHLLRLYAGLYQYAQTNRLQLTDNNKIKTVKLPAGDLIWRMGKAKVELNRDEEEIIENLKKLKLERFFIKTEKIDKQTMIKERDLATTIEGITIDQQEAFSVKPAEVKAFTFNEDELKKFLPADRD